MSNQTPESWEDELARQAEGVNLNDHPELESEEPQEGKVSPFEVLKDLELER